MSDATPAPEEETGPGPEEVPEGGFQEPTGAVSDLGDLPGDENHPDLVPVADESAPLSQADDDDDTEGPNS